MMSKMSFVFIPTISPLPGLPRVHVRVLLCTPGQAGAPFCPSWLPHASTEVSLSLSSLSPQKKITFDNV